MDQTFGVKSKNTLLGPRFLRFFSYIFNKYKFLHFYRFFKYSVRIRPRIFLSYRYTCWIFTSSIKLLSNFIKNQLGPFLSSLFCCTDIFCSIDRSITLSIDCYKYIRLIPRTAFCFSKHVLAILAPLPFKIQNNNTYIHQKDFGGLLIGTAWKLYINLVRINILQQYFNPWTWCVFL